MASSAGRRRLVGVARSCGRLRQAGIIPPRREASRLVLALANAEWARRRRSGHPQRPCHGWRLRRGAQGTPARARKARHRPVSGPGTPCRCGLSRNHRGASPAGFAPPGPPRGRVRPGGRCSAAVVPAFAPGLAVHAGAPSTPSPQARVPAARRPPARTWTSVCQPDGSPPFHALRAGSHPWGVRQVASHCRTSACVGMRPLLTSFSSITRPGVASRS